MTDKEWNKANGLCQSREYWVVKSNYLIQKSRYQLSAQEQKLILYMISKIKPEDDELALYDFDLKDLCAICGITYNNKNYRNFKASIENLSNKSFWLQRDNEEILCRWVRKAVIHRQGTRVKVGFDEDLKPFLLKLKDNFTVYELSNVLVMTGKYSIRIYEILKSYAYKGSYTVGVEELKEMLQTSTYKEWQNFKVRVIDNAVNEINENTDLNISYSTERDGRKTTSITFSIQKKSDLDKTITMVKRSGKLNKNEAPGQPVWAFQVVGNVISFPKKSPLLEPCRASQSIYKKGVVKMVGLLAYNPQTDRIGLLKSDLWVNEGFHCGTPLKVNIDGSWIDTRIEMDCNNQWYLTGTSIVGNDAFLYLEAEI